jgi:hypothetical protein
MRRLTTGAICAAMLCVTAGRPAEAGIIPDLYNFIFGPPGVGYQAFYGPTYGAYYGGGYTYGAAYGGGFGGYGGYGGNGACCPPVYQSYYVAPSPVCDPCAPCRPACAPCDVPRGGYVEDDEWSAAPGNGGAPRTYRENGPGGPPPDLRNPRVPGGRLPNGQGPADSFEPPAGEFDDEDRETLKPAEPVPQRGAEGAPVTDPEEDNGGAPAGDELFFPQLRLEAKMTWRAEPLRSRLVIRSRFPTPGIARTRVNPNADWMPVTGETKIVRK